MFRTDLLSIIRSLNTVFTATCIFHASYVDCLLARSGCSSEVQHVYVRQCGRYQGGRTTHVLSEPTITTYRAREVSSQTENDKGITRGPPGGNHKNYCRLECDAVTFDVHAPTFRRKHSAARYLYISSKLRGTISQKTAVSGR